MGIWDSFKTGFEDGVGFAGETIAGWFGANNHQNDGSQPETIDYVLYILNAAALLGLVIMIMVKLVF
jgi:hypothetical protein